jgi:putative DNA primase/helicase
LAEVFNRDADLVSFVQRALGYSLTGLTREQVFFTCWAAGCNGKSTLLNAVASVLDDYAKPLKADALMTHPFKNSGGADPEVASLVRVRLVTAQEPRSGSLDTAKVKELTGQDAIQVRELHKMPFTFVPQFKLWLSTNERPNVAETTTGIWRRLRLVPFTVNFEGRKDERLPEELAAQASGILNWLLAGCLAWQQDGLGDAEAVREATREYREDEDPYIEFFAEVLRRDEPGGRVELKMAYAAFQTWVRDACLPYLGDRDFSKQAEAHGFPKRKSNSIRYPVGCVLSAASAASADTEGDLPNPSHEANREEFRSKPDSAALSALSPEEQAEAEAELLAAGWTR